MKTKFHKGDKIKYIKEEQKLRGVFDHYEKDQVWAYWDNDDTLSWIAEDSVVLVTPKKKKVVKKCRCFMLPESIKEYSKIYPLPSPYSVTPGCPIHDIKPVGRPKKVKEISAPEHVHTWRNWVLFTNEQSRSCVTCGWTQVADLEKVKI